MIKKSKYGMPPAQNFADPNARQMELDAFEQQRQAYNDEMTRLMAEGGEVNEDPQDKAARSIIKDFEGYGYTKEEIMELADKVAAAGRGGDELLAYLSPESVEFLKENGGAGTTNPLTGLPEFKGGFIGDITKKIENAFSPSQTRGQTAVPRLINESPENIQYPNTVFEAAENASMPRVSLSQKPSAPVDDSPVYSAAVPDYTSRGVGAIQGIGSAATNPYLSPNIFGGAQNAGLFPSSANNQAAISGMAPYRPFGFAKGGDVSMKDIMAMNAETLSDEEPEEVINTDPVGTAQKMLADLNSAGKPSPTRQAIKRTKTSPGDGAEADKAMQMIYEDLAKGDLGAMKDRAPAARNTESARSQMEELARIYQLKIRAAQQQARGLSADTFGAPTLEGPTLTKNRLTKNRFKEGGEAKKSDAFNRAKGSPEEGEESSDGFYAPFFRAALGIPEEGETSITDQLIGAGETALTLGSGALSSAVGMPYGLYKGLTSGKYLEGKAPQIADKEAAAFIERNTYVPRSQTGKENLEALGKITDALKLAPTPGGAAMASLARPKAVQAQTANMAKDFQQYNQQLSAPGASYAVRPTGSTMLTGPVGMDRTVSNIDQLLQAGVKNSVPAAGRGTEQQKLIEQFWNTKARNYFTRQFGTPNDPVATAISKKQIKGTALEEAFPEYMLDQIAAGTNRVNAEGQERFFPKYPRAMEDFTSRYDKATGLKGNLLVEDSASVLDPGYSYIGSKGREVGRNAGDREADKMIRQGVRPELINTEIGVTTRDLDDPAKLVSDGTSAAKDLYAAFQDSVAYNKLTPAQKTKFNKNQYFLRTAGMTDEEVGKSFLAENVRTAIEKGEPVYDIAYMGKPLEGLFRPENINEYLATLNPRQLANIRFEDAVGGGLKMRERAAQLANVEQRIRDGKPVADAVFSDGVSAPLLQFGKDSGLEGFAWKRIEKREATIPEGAYVGHSVGGYEKGGATYTKEKRDGFNSGKYEVYTLRDNRNRPVNTIEVTMMDEITPIVTQIKGNGRATGNVPAEKYDGAVLRFLQDYLMPAAIEESDNLLTPLLQNYKAELGPSPRYR